MISVMKRAVPYLLIPLLFAALVLHHAKGLVVCVCDDGGIVIETSCGESGCCSEATHPSGELHTEEGCRSCTQIPLGANDTLSRMLPATSKVQSALFLANLTDSALPQPAPDSGEPAFHSTDAERVSPPSNRLAVMRI